VRYAFYISPDEDDPLSAAAAGWLGANPFTGETWELEPSGDFSAAELTALTADPRRYGFHGTLKAPFALAPSTTEMQLLNAFAAFTEESTPFEIPEMTLGQLGPFFALVPAVNCSALQDLADETVRRFSPFRAPLSQADIARRKPELLEDAMRRNLFEWGYPYVFESFRFHMTLTGPGPPGTAGRHEGATGTSLRAVHRQAASGDLACAVQRTSAWGTFYSSLAFAARRHVQTKDGMT
jgi:hypothetical protein